jgi:hypothetical protein
VPQIAKDDNKLMAASCNENRSVYYPVVVVEVNRIKYRALLDTGAGNSYASSALIKLPSKV